MSREKLYSSYRWNEPIKAIVNSKQKQSKKEHIKSKKTLLKILVENKTLTQDEADKMLDDFIKEFK